VLWARENLGSVLLLEHGAPWRRDALKLARDAHQVIVVREEPGEEESALRHRLMKRCAESIAGGVKLRSAALMCAEETGATRLTSRANTLCRVLSVLGDSEVVRLVLVAPRREDCSLNTLLPRLGTLIERCVDAGISVQVRSAGTDAVGKRATGRRTSRLPRPHTGAPAHLKDHEDLRR
jgi:hypothetical protein